MVRPPMVRPPVIRLPMIRPPMIHPPTTHPRRQKTNVFPERIQKRRGAERRVGKSRTPQFDLQPGHKFQVCPIQRKMENPSS